MTITFTIPLKPVAAARPRISGKARYYPAAYTAYRKDLALHLAQHKPAEPLAGPLHVKCEFVMPRPKSSKFTTPAGDVDNLWKAITDSCQFAGFYTDDRNIVSGTFSKRFVTEGEDPHTTVNIRQL